MYIWCAQCLQKIFLVASVLIIVTVVALALVGFFHDGLSRTSLLRSNPRVLMMTKYGTKKMLDIQKQRHRL